MPSSICIVTPSFNQGRFIERTIQSVLTQDADGIDYVVMDGGSTDGTIEILKQYSGRVRWVSKPDKGPADAIIQGMAASDAPVAAWLNSDDVYHPGAVAAALAYLNAHPEIDVAYGEAEHIDEHGDFIERYPTEDFDFERLKDRCFISQPASFIRRRAFERAGPLNTAVRQMDYEFWLRLAKAGGSFGRFPAIAAATRLHAQAYSVGQRLRGHAEVNDFTRAILGRTPDKWLFNYGHAVLEKIHYGRDKPGFSLAVSAVSLYAALRWNGRVSKEMLRTIRSWM
ncbi:MAG: glycosyltransferase [Desulfovibrionaceae bacterium]|nr:glycosyltransferase [Desulfovibrionaceae bacterium]MBF0514000.1 glycosyltransferase [Desulfovibrionaceae bacterium]